MLRTEPEKSAPTAVAETMFSSCSLQSRRVAPLRLAFCSCSFSTSDRIMMTPCIIEPVKLESTNPVPSKVVPRKVENGICMSSTRMPVSCAPSKEAYGKSESVMEASLMIALSKVTLTPIGFTPRMLRMLIICIDAPVKSAWLMVAPVQSVLSSSAPLNTALVQSEVSRRAELSAFHASTTHVNTTPRPHTPSSTPPAGGEGAAGHAPSLRSLHRWR
mmetsp:Transcript_49969/g.161905  ORF Transcript_49969/g.161905 Transcript_49969/m.161905 type:complete len:217 (+) Transcript_49969:240-890(+)